MVVVVGLDTSLTRFPLQVQDIMSSPTSRALPAGHGSHAPPDNMKKFSAHSSEEPRMEIETVKAIIDSLFIPTPKPPRMGNVTYVKKMKKKKQTTPTSPIMTLTCTILHNGYQ